MEDSLKTDGCLFLRSRKKLQDDLQLKNHISLLLNELQLMESKHFKGLKLRA
jgi:hypothetical protein